MKYVNVCKYVKQFDYYRVSTASEREQAETEKAVSYTKLFTE